MDFNEDTNAKVNTFDVLPITKKYLSDNTSTIFDNLTVVYHLLLMPITSGIIRALQSFREIPFPTLFYSIVFSRQALFNCVTCTANILSIVFSIIQISQRLILSLKLCSLQQYCITKSIEILSVLPVHSYSVFYYTFIQELKNCLLNYRLKLSTPLSHCTKQIPSNCCTLDVLAEPPSGEPIRADIVFIHGLHGSLKNTWRQGLWDQSCEREQFEKLPKPLKHLSKHITKIRLSQRRKSIHYSFKVNQLHLAIDSHTDFSNEFQDNTNKCTNKQLNKTVFSTNNATLNLNVNQENCKGQSNIIECRKLGIDSRNHCQPFYDTMNYAKCWPADWLPLDCSGVRVIAINYTTDALLWRPIWKKKEPRTSLIQRAQEMTELLLKYHVGSDHPIVYVGHSKGGLFIKQIIVDAWENGRPDTAPLWRSAKGIFFYSVPHKGSNLASIRVPLMTRSIELVDIEKNNKYLLDLHRRFVELYQARILNTQVFSFVETALTCMSFLYLRIVDENSADPGIGDVCCIRLDHREICKPRNRNFRSLERTEPANNFRQRYMTLFCECDKFNKNSIVMLVSILLKFALSFLQYYNSIF